MKREVLFRAIVGMLMLMRCSINAQLPDAFRPASSNARYAEYPRVSPDRQVSFQLSAPKAQRVQLVPAEVSGGNGLGKGPYDMVKDDNGVWSLTIGPVAPGIHFYSFDIDGAQVTDPSSDDFYFANHAASAVEIAEAGVDFYLPRDVPHGDVRIHWYHSKVTGTWRRIHVYFPPGYDESKSRYPVLYLNHGGGEDDTAWVRQGRMNFILDNLLAEKKATPMIVVMDAIYAYNPAEPKIPGERPDLPAAPPNHFEEVVVSDLIPMIDATYRTIADRDHRAIAGLSLGSTRALEIGFDHSELFSWVGAFSCGTLQNADPDTKFNGIWKDAAAFNKKFHLLFLSNGTEEMHRNWIPQLHERLSAMGVKNVYFESPGTSHEWLNWRRAFGDFVPRLFH